MKEWQQATGNRPPLGTRANLSAGSYLSPVACRLSPYSARGIALVAALFLIVVVAAIGAFAVRISGSQQQTVNLSLLTSRALAAANSGVEFAAYQALYGTGCANTTLNLTEAGLIGYTVSVTCNPSSHTEGGSPINVYGIDATATLGTYGQPDYVSRHVYATFTSAT